MSSLRGEMFKLQVFWLDSRSQLSQPYSAEAATRKERPGACRGPWGSPDGFCLEVRISLQRQQYAYTCLASWCTGGVRKSFYLASLGTCIYATGHDLVSLDL